MNVSELKNYVAAQIELGEDLVFFNEATPRLLKPQFSRQKPVVSAFQATPQSALKQIPEKSRSPRVQIIADSNSIAGKATLDISKISIVTPSPRNDSWRSARTLNDFYEEIAKHQIYFGSLPIQGQGEFQNPKIFLIFDFPKPSDFVDGNFFLSPVGEMLLKMFAALRVPKSRIYCTYIYKKNAGRAPSPLLDLELRAMLQKEIELTRPEILVTFGELSMRQLLGRDKVLRTLAGTPLQFAGTKMLALLDARSMLTNVQLKRDTWKLHIPNCGFFKS